MCCLTLTNELRAKSAGVCFVCRSFLECLSERIVSEEHTLYLLIGFFNGTVRTEIRI